MLFNRGTGLVLASVATIFVSGCTSSRLGAIDTVQPAPVNPAPAGVVQSGQLPPPTPAIGTAPAGASDGSAFPQAPQTSTDVVTTGDGGTTISTDTTTQTSPSVTQSTAAPLTRESMGGVWTATTAGTSCRIATSLTRGGSDFRAASLGCDGELADIGFWNLNGTQVILKDRSGNQVATLFASGTNQFNGQTSGGRAVSLAR
ncbi:MAG: AprI/Inh family metalloprotease inhibitor [Pseudomonadota bacterium]